MATVPLTRTALVKAADRAALAPTTYRVLMVLANRADRHGVIPDARQPHKRQVIADEARCGYENAGLILAHLEKHGWVTRVKGTYAGGRLLRYVLSIGMDCECKGTRKPLTSREKDGRIRDRKRGMKLVPVVTGPVDGRTAIYRFYNADGVLLYVGITNDLHRRWKKHAEEKSWWPDVRRQTVDWLDNRSEALSQEARAIRTERPVYNVMGSEGTQWCIKCGRPSRRSCRTCWEHAAFELTAS